MPPAAARHAHPHGAERAALDAAQLLSDGTAALLRKDYAAAGPLLGEFYRQTQHPQGLYQLGLLAQAEGRLLAAQDLLRRCLSDRRVDSPLSAAAVAEAQRILSLPRPPHGKMNITGESGALILLDGQLVGALPLSRPLLVPPGKRTLAIEDGRHHQREEIDVAVGRFIEVTYERKSAALLSSELPGVLVFEDYSGLPKEAAAPLGQAIEDTLQSERLSPFPLAVALTQAGLPPKSPCLTTLPCQLTLAQKSELDYVLVVHLTPPTPSAPGQLRLSLIDVEVGAEAAHAQPELAAGDVAQSAAALASHLSLLIAEARRRPRGELTITSTPPGAEVRLAGQTLGPTPLVRTTWSGRLELEVTLPGYDPQRLPLVLDPDGKAALAVTLLPEVAEPAPAPLLVAPPRYRPPARRPVWRLALGGIALGTGALLVGFGGGALAADGRCTDTPADPFNLCSRVYSTLGLGAGLVIGGGVLLLSGAVLVLTPPAKSPPVALTK